MTDELDNLSDEKLSELFALEVAGMTKRTEGLFWSADDKRAYILTGSALHDVRKKMRLPCTPALMLSFATDANAVLPWLERAGYFFRVSGIRAQWTVQIWNCRGEQPDGVATSATLSRAACVALILAKRAEKGGA